MCHDVDANVCKRTITTHQLLNAKYAIGRIDFIVEVEGVLKLVKIDRTPLTLRYVPKSIQHLFINSDNYYGDEISKIVEIQTIEREELTTQYKYLALNYKDQSNVKIINNVDSSYSTIGDIMYNYTVSLYGKYITEILENSSLVMNAIKEQN
jgi:hypothetical protein